MLVHVCSIDVTYRLEDSSRTQILNVNRPSNHPRVKKPRQQMKQAHLPTKTAVALGPGRPISVTKFSVKVKFTITGTEFGNCTKAICLKLNVS